MTWGKARDTRNLSPEQERKREMTIEIYASSSQARAELERELGKRWADAVSAYGAVAQLAPAPQWSAPQPFNPQAGWGDLPPAANMNSKNWFLWDSFLKRMPGPVVIGVWIGEIFFPDRFAEDAYWQINNPGGWAEYECPTPPYPTFGTIGPTTTGWMDTPGVDPGNCIIAQFVSGSGNEVRRSYWSKYGPAANQHGHIITFHDGSAAKEPNPTVDWVPEVVPGAMPVSPGVAPWFNPWIPTVNPFSPRPSPRSKPDALTPLNPWPIPGTMPWSIDMPQVQPNGLNRPQPLTPQRPLPDAEQPLNRPPRSPRTKERKGKLKTPGIQAINTMLNLVTESVDALMCAQKALPAKYRPKPVWVANGVKPPGNPFKKENPKYASHVQTGSTVNWKWSPGVGWHRAKGYYRAPVQQEVMAAVYQHFDKIDIGELMLCLLENHIEDAIIGALGSAGAKANPGAQKGPAL